ncbi:helix-turn-helix domain-containing protein [Bradyrhizobium jicamae]|uniref:Helix-turn-helix domain-containing protein n=1 Tax=Bradyrhizobium jicamae TaxID=280332 RepID=A0ABS5FS02_9BRAD|nr:helix-turn-helix transcriptional regulator [Bradyrhizobium jicamae]MBR0799597.1 helix-turn-helix domain-containing protein [Bradyrhizobium jicamae]
MRTTDRPAIFRKPESPGVARGFFFNSISARRVGVRLKSIRKARKISLVQLAEITGLSLGPLSGLERGTVAPTLRSLTALAGAFGVPPGWFYDLDHGALHGEVVLRRGAGRQFTWADGIEKTLLNPDLGGTLEMVLVTIAPHGSSGPQSYTR